MQKIEDFFLGCDQKVLEKVIWPGSRRTGEARVKRGLQRDIG
ncbi:hypothetical protein [Pseudomonas fluorescens]|jgi:hypothetical protein|nr:hypothetical protein [Pseudomonas fluorescens]